MDRILITAQIHLKIILSIYGLKQIKISDSKTYNQALFYQETQAGTDLGPRIPF